MTRLSNFPRVRKHSLSLRILEKWKGLSFFMLLKFEIKSFCVCCENAKKSKGKWKNPWNILCTWILAEGAFELSAV